MTTHAASEAGAPAIPYDDAPLLDARTVSRTEALVKRYIWTSTVFLVVAGLLGLILRIHQADIIGVDPNLWYAMMTAHGLGAFVAWAAFFLMGAIYWVLLKLGFPLRTYVFAEIAYWTMVVGTLGIVFSTLIAGFAASWVALYPLPFYSAGEWGDAATGVFSVATLLAGVSIIAWCVALIIAVTGPAVSSARGGWFHRLGLALGLGLLWPSRFRHADRKLPYPVVPITVIAIDMFLATLPFALLLVVMVIQSFDNSFTIDVQVAKNLLWAFGHPVVYLLLFPVVACLYYLIPRYAKRELVAGRVVVVAWLVALTANLFVWAHHVYMDFPDGSVQKTLNLIHEPTTFSLTLPSALSLYSLGATIYRSNFQWNSASKFLVAGIIGWLSAGFSGVVNADIQFNQTVHNTLWVVGHFHHMAFLGMGMVIFGVMYAAIPALTHRPIYSERLGSIHLWGMLIGGYGWVVCWLAEGLEGAPRRWEMLPDGYEFWTVLSIPFMLILAASVAVGLWNLLRSATASPWQIGTTPEKRAERSAA